MELAAVVSGPVMACGASCRQPDENRHLRRLMSGKELLRIAVSGWLCLVQ